MLSPCTPDQCPHAGAKTQIGPRGPSSGFPQHRIRDLEIRFPTCSQRGAQEGNKCCADKVGRRVLTWQYDDKGLLAMLPFELDGRRRWQASWLLTNARDYCLEWQERQVSRETAENDSGDPPPERSCYKSELSSGSKTGRLNVGIHGHNDPVNAPLIRKR